MRYAIVIEKAPSNYAAYVLDLPGCIATGAMWQKPNPSSVKPLNFILKDSRPMAFLCLQPAAKSNISTFLPKTAQIHASAAFRLSIGEMDQRGGRMPHAKGIILRLVNFKVLFDNR